METEIRIVDVPDTGTLRRYARRRIAPIVTHPRNGIEGVSVSVARLPRREPEGVRCRILGQVTPRLRLSVEKAGDSAQAAIDAAADRLGWALGFWHGVA